MRVRFAPSPTGSLHIGGARTALFNILLAQQSGGVSVLRLEDTDRERSLPEHEAEILESLKWLGLKFDEGVEEGGDYGPYRQSARMERHLALASQLQNEGSAYLDEENCVRLKYPDSDIIVNDLVCGECVFAVGSLGPDPVIVRSDGTPTFHLANVSDDIDMKITHIVRGQDHLTNTAKHVVLFKAAGAELPQFAHLPLLLGEDGSKLSKRNSQGFTMVREFVEGGYLPEALLNFLTLLGWSHPEGKEIFDFNEAVQSFSTDRVNTTGAKFELSKLDWFNGQYIRSLTPDELASRTIEWTGQWREEIERKGSLYWKEAITALQSDFTHLTQVESLAGLLLADEINVNDEAREAFSSDEWQKTLESVRSNILSIIDEQATEDGAETYSEEHIKKFIKLLRKKVDAPPKQIFQSMRTLTTGALKGPELDVLLPHVPRSVLQARISGAFK